MTHTYCPKLWKLEVQGKSVRMVSSAEGSVPGLLMTIFSLCLHISLISFLIRALILFIKTHPHDLVTSQMPHLQKPSQLELELPHRNLSGYKHVIYCKEKVRMRY